jgi:hypothetical protein
MEHRAMLWERVWYALQIVGMVLIPTWGFPLVARLMKVTNPRAAFLWKLEPIGWVLLTLAPIVLLGVVVWTWWRIRRRQDQIHAAFAKGGVTYVLLPRPDAPLTRADKVALWQRFSHILPRGEHLAWELTGTEKEQRFSLRTASLKTSRAAIIQLMTEYPGVEVRRVKTPADDPLWVEEGYSVVWREVSPTKGDQPLDMATPDPQMALLGELALLPSGVQAGVQVLVRQDFHTRSKLLKQAAKATSKKPASGPHAPRASSAEKRDVQSVDSRARESFVEVQVVVWASAVLEGMARDTVNHLTATLEAQYAPGNPLKPSRDERGDRYGRTMPAFRGQGWTTREIGTLAHLVGGETKALAPRLARARARALLASADSCVPRSARVASFIYDFRRGHSAPEAEGNEAILETTWESEAVLEVSWDTDLGQDEMAEAPLSTILPTGAVAERIEVR